jgi:hypothetical protein
MLLGSLKLFATAVPLARAPGAAAAGMCRLRLKGQSRNFANGMMAINSLKLDVFLVFMYCTHSL